ncbi:MAG: WbqC family protein [Bacteroidetes bacterium]|nr:WbqC family protein [Bacteroidota bacterium]
MSLLFSTAYLPPASYILQAIKAGSITIEAHEHFVKQSYRSRCSIYGPNGKQDLIIPIVHEKLYEVPIKEVKIANDSRWQKIHWRSIEAAYKNSPYFEFYEKTPSDPITKKYDFLLISISN